ncbi:MAG: RNA polymerase subunit sigma-70 [Planctomycetaceae bacterium]|nr:RNA polymerase subunit sigma-70 [Planctomycetaceae bacterium]
MHSNYQNTILRELRDQQVRYAPREKKVEQINRAEKLLTEIDAKKTYSYEYVCYRITDYRPDSTPHKTLSGDEAKHDLRLFVEDVSDAADIRAEEVGEPVHTVEDLSRLFKVSTKTISRWREQGLVSRRLLFGGRKRVGFLRSSVDRFVAANHDRVKRGERFSQLTDEERDEIVERARRMSAAGGCPSDVARRLAKQMDRSVETIRYTLKQFDDKYPDLAVFPSRSGVLTEEIKQRIYNQHRRGVSADALARRYCRTRTSIYRIVGEMRAQRILELPLDYIYNECFEKAKLDKKILGPMPEPETKTRKTRAPSGLPPYLTSLYDTPLLTREQEYHLFRKFNYLKHKAGKLRESLDPGKVKSSTLEQIEKLYQQAVEIKNQIVQSNLRLVVSIAKRHVTATDDFFTLVSDGNMSLIRAAEKFDYSRGNKFSTYASWAIMKNFARTIPTEFKHRDRFRTSLEEMFASREDDRSDQLELENAQKQRAEQINRILARLDEREQKIIISRFGLDYSQEPQTLKEVGVEMGVTKERVRQIEARALNKLRAAAQEEHLDLSE